MGCRTQVLLALVGAFFFLRKMAPLTLSILDFPGSQEGAWANTCTARAGAELVSLITSWRRRGTTMTGALARDTDQRRVRESDENWQCGSFT